MLGLCVCSFLAFFLMVTCGLLQLQSAHLYSRKKKGEETRGKEEREIGRVDINFSENSNALPMSSLISYRPEFSLLPTVLGYTI